MAFLVEDGTGLAAANSYLSVADADTYHQDRGNASGWAVNNAEKEIALIRATEFVDAKFGHRFRGQKLTHAQRLQWPRQDAFDDIGTEYDNAAVPGKLGDAIAEYALRALTLGQQFSPDPVLGYSTRDTTGSGKDQTTGQGAIQRIEERVGPISTETEYQRVTGTAGGSNAVNLPSYPAADVHLKPLLRPAGAVRA